MVKLLQVALMIISASAIQIKEGQSAPYVSPAILTRPSYETPSTMEEGKKGPQSGTV